MQALETRSGILPFLLHYLTISKKSDAWCNSLMSHYVEISLPREATAKRGICYNTFSVRLRARLFFVCMSKQLINHETLFACSFTIFRFLISNIVAKLRQGPLNVRGV